MAEHAVESLLSILPAASLSAFLVTYLASKAGFFRPLSAADYPRTPDFGDFAFVFLTYLLFQALLFPLIVKSVVSLYSRAWVDPGEFSGHDLIWINCIGQWATIPCLAIFCKLFKPEILTCVSRNDTARTPGDRLYNLLLGAATWVISYPVVFVLNLILAEVTEFFFHSPEVDQVAVKILKMTFNDPVLLAFSFGAIVLVAPVVEEFMFRGVLQPWIRSKVGPLLGIMITSTAFSGIHFSSSQGIYNLELLPALFLLSCYLGYLYERQRSLWAPVGLHMTFNLVSAVMLINQGS